MKIERFLKWIQDQMLNYPDISFITLKMFMDKFNNCLSNNERERWKTEILLIREFTLKQFTIDETVYIAKIKNLKHQLTKIKQNEVNKLK